MQGLTLVPQSASADVSTSYSGAGYYNNRSIFTAIDRPSAAFVTQSVTVTGVFNTSTTIHEQVPSIDWFAMAPEVRCRIYRELIGDIIVNVDDSVFPPIYVRRPGSSALNSYGPPILPTNNSSWIVVSRRFFQEIREELWKIVKALEFERRWDFLNAFANQSLEVTPANTVPSGFDNTFMFPIGTNIFSKIQQLSLNLTKTSDFRGIVHTAEAERVTLNILNIAKNSMPALRKLVLRVDSRSRLQDDFVVFLPSGWLLERLLSIPHLREISFRPAGDFRGPGFKRGANQACVWALNAILKEHLEATDQYDRLTYGINGSNLAKELRIVVGRKMVAFLRTTKIKYDVYWTQLETKCNTLATSI